jgi:hypothetical protein
LPSARAPAIHGPSTSVGEAEVAVTSEGDTGLVKGLLGLGEDRLNDAVGQLLANERFVGAMQSAISGGLNAKRSVDKNVERIYSLANVPTLEDVEQVRDKMLELEDLLAEVRDRVVRLDERLRAREGATKKAGAKKAPAKKKSTGKAAPKKKTAARTKKAAK